VTDIFREIEEDVRRDQLEKLWKRYGDYIIAGAAALVIGIAGYKLWQYYETKQTLKASNAYIAAMQLSEGANNAQAALTFAQIAKSAPGGYAETARLAQADTLAVSGKPDDAVALYKSIAEKDKNEIGALARIRAAWIQADNASCTDQQTLLAPIDGASSSWRYMAGEILAYCDFRDGRAKKAEDEFAGLARQSEAPSTLRQRAAAMAALIRTGGDYGKVPPPPKPAAAPEGQPSP
jgi:hypothetical protein